MNWIHDDGKRLNSVFGSKVYKNYNRIKRFGGIGIEESSGAFSYCSCTGKDGSGYFIPAELTDEQILEAIEKSVKEDHDYLYDLVAKPENKVVYEPGVCY